MKTKFEAIKNPTRKNQRIIKTLDVKDMLGMYLAEDIVNRWTEDFLEEETGHVVSIERSELLYRKGEKVTQELQQKINFDIIEGSIKEPVVLTNQDRRGIAATSIYMRKYKAKVYVSNEGKCKVVMLQAISVMNAYDIICDYFETNTVGVFTIRSIEVVDDSSFVEDEVTHFTDTDFDKMYMEGSISFSSYCDRLDDAASDYNKGDDNRLFWKISYIIEYGYTKKKDTFKGEEPSTFIVHTLNAETATKAVLRHLTKEDHAARNEEVRKAEGEKVYTLQLHEAKQLPISAIIPVEYTIDNQPEKSEDE